MGSGEVTRYIGKYGTERVLINSAADWGISDPLKVVKTATTMSEAGYGDEEIDKVVWQNPVEFFGQSGRQQLDEVEADRRATFEGNSVLRGERPAS